MASRHFHAFLTTADPSVLDTVAADSPTVGTRSSKQIRTVLKGSVLAHLPSGMYAASKHGSILAAAAFDLTWRPTCSLTFGSTK